MPSSPSSANFFPRKEIAFLVLAGIFLVSLVVANLITAKLFVIFGIVLAAGIIPYPITFLATDLICEVYGKRRAQVLVFVGFVLSFYVLFLIKMGQLTVPFAGLNRQPEYDVIFGNSARAIIASMIAYLVAQFLDVHLFHFWKRVTQGRHLWLRNNGSTMISQLVDTVLVVTILFYGDLPASQIIQIIIAGYCFKLIIAGTDTPLFYLGTRYLTWFVQDTAEPLSRQILWRDGALLAACAANIAIVISGAVIWKPGEPLLGIPNIGLLLVLIGAGAHIATTVACAQPQLARKIGLVLGCLGIATAALGWQTALMTIGPTIAQIGGIMLAGAGVILVAKT
jgi:queuosine precursor transporter